MFKLFVLTTALAIANADYLTGQHAVEISSPSITSQSSNVLRNQGNLAQVSSYSKTIDAPFSSQSKSDIRISNPSIYKHDGPIIYNSHANGVPHSGFARGDAPAFSSAPSVSHVTYNTGPVAYATAPTLASDPNSYGPSYTDHTIGSSRENTVQSHDANNAVTHYSKAVDTSFSSVRKTDSRLTTDAKIVSVAPSLTYATAAAYASPGDSTADPTVAYSSAPVVAHATFAGFGTQYNW